MITLYLSLIYPFLIHCNLAYKSHITKLQVLQNKAVCIVTVSNPRSDIKLLYRNNGFLNLHVIRICMIGKFMYMIFTMVVYHIFFEGFFTQNHSIYDYDIIIASIFHVYFCSTNLSQTSIRLQEAMIWNKIHKAVLNSNCTEASFLQTCWKMCPSKHHQLSNRFNI